MKQIVFILLMAFNSNVFAAKKAGISIPDKVTIDGKELQLNGIGVRRATFLRIKVYVGGLYLEKKTQKVEEILSSSYPKYIPMHFMRDVDKEDLQEAWLEGLKAAVKEADRKEIMKSFNEFNSNMADIKKGQSILITLKKDGVQMSFAGKKTFIKNQKLSRAILSIWFINAKDEQLRDEFMGKS